MISFQGRVLLLENDLLLPFDASDHKYSWIDRNAISFKIRNDGGLTPTFRAYTDCDLTQLTVRPKLSSNLMID